MKGIEGDSAFLTSQQSNEGAKFEKAYKSDWQSIKDELKNSEIDSSSIVLQHAVMESSLSYCLLCIVSNDKSKRLIDPVDALVTFAASVSLPSACQHSATDLLQLLEENQALQETRFEICTLSRVLSRWDNKTLMVIGDWQYATRNARTCQIITPSDLELNSNVALAMAGHTSIVIVKEEVDVCLKCLFEATSERDENPEPVRVIRTKSLEYGQLVARHK